LIIDLNKFIARERPFWSELEEIVRGLEREPELKLGLEEVRRFHYLYQRASADLARITTFSSEREIRRYLESLVGRAYGEIHMTRKKPHRLAPIKWFFRTLPQTFRKHVNAFWLALLITMVGGAFGGIATVFDPGAKQVLMPFPHLQGDPSERVAEEERADRDRLESVKATFSSYLMTHNTKVSIFAFALGMTWGIGTVILLFYNGVILGAVAFDYVRAGEAEFLLGWLLPHGAVEIPAILLASQAGLVLAGALIGWGEPLSLRRRLQEISSDLVTLIFGVGLMLIWAGIVEGFFSQYHEPVIPYPVKIGFGMVELVLLYLFFWKAGAKAYPPRKDI
jgi:uncharacterized membrane protein SpoIIM required for sporulation